MNSLAALLVLFSLAVAAPDNDSNDEPQNDSNPPVKSDGRTVVRWSFDRASEPGRWSKRADDIGPRPPSYPGFAADNRAASLAAGSRLVLVDDRPEAGLRFSQGESLTLEAWVRTRQLKPGQYAYIVGKGRSGGKRFAEKNQNYALRLKGDRHGARISFLFASQPQDGQAGEWHRWTSQESFEPGSRWHHVAVSYTFGKPASVRGYIDGREVRGTWDLGGATTRPPVSDADDLIIGAGNGGAPNNSFDGWLDELAIRRGTVPAEEMQARFVYVPPPPPVKREALPPFFETLLGGFVGKSKRRPELGETVVAISPEGSESWQLLTPGDRPIAYTDSGWAGYAAQQRRAIEALNARARSVLRAAHAAYWDRRREAALAYLNQTPEVPVPALPTGYPAHNAIDHFIAARLAAAKAQASGVPAGGVHFYREILPILETKCFDCHRGSKVQGGLRLDSLAAACKGGESYGPAIVPGKPEQSALLARIRSTDPDDVMPPKGERLAPEQIELVERWIGEGAHWPEFQLDRTTFTPLAEDLAFLRRVALHVA